MAWQAVVAADILAQFVYVAGLHRGNSIMYQSTE